MNNQCKHRYGIWIFVDYKDPQEGTRVCRWCEICAEEQIGHVMQWRKRKKGEVGYFNSAIKEREIAEAKSDKKKHIKGD